MNNIVFIDSTTDYPFSFSAGNTKVELLSKGLIENDDIITIINSPVIGRNYVDKYTCEINNEITCHHFSKSKNPIKIIQNLVQIVRIVKNNRIKNADNSIFVSDPPYLFFYIFDILLAKLFGYKLFVILHEWHISVDSISLKQKIGLYFYDHLFGYFCDGILPISEFLENKSKKFRKPIMRLPILADFSNDFEKTIDTSNNYFLYCVGAQYIDIIDKMLNQFKSLLKGKEDIKLVLVLYGSEDNIKRVNQIIIEKELIDYTQIKTGINYDDLFDLYSNALALLIPLNDTIQDNARFSQKIAEYLSSKRPIITTNVGEIRNYFVDNENAFIANSIMDDSFVEKLKYIIDNKDIASEVGLNGYILGRSRFDYKIISKELRSFISNIKN